MPHSRHTINPAHDKHIPIPTNHNPKAVRKGRVIHRYNPVKHFLRVVYWLLIAGIALSVVALFSEVLITSAVK